jgi:hypothetical protein
VRLLLVSLAMLLVACGGSDESPAPENAGWRVGVTVADISPNEDELAGRDVYMGAYGILTARGAATGVHDPIYARTMVLKNASSTIAMTILDLPGISNRALHAIADQVLAKTQLSSENVFVGATHSHSAPDLQGLWGHVPDDYKQRLIDLTAQSISDAFNAAEPAELFVAKGTAPNRNRRGHVEIDSELTVLDAKTTGGRRLGTLINFAAHPVKLGADNKLISRDFCGYTVDRAEAALGGKVLFFNGVVGDASPDGGGSGYEGAEGFGNIVADAAIAAVAGETKVTPGIYRDQEKWQEPVTNEGFKLLNDAGVLDYDIEPVGDGLGIRTQFTYFRLGTQVQAVAFPGEALTRTGLEIKSRMTSPYRLFLGLTTDTLGYFVKSDEWMMGHNDNYEESVSLGQTAGDNAVRILSDAIDEDPAP